MNRDSEFSTTDVARLLGNQQPDAAPTEPGMASRVAARALRVIEEVRRRHALRQELVALDQDGDLDRILGEAQLNRADVETMLANHPASGRLLNEMAARLHVEDRLHADPTTERDLWRVCTLCDAQGRCKHWLASGATEGFEEFCPNAETLDELRHAKA